MPLPNDTLGRWWIETAGINPDLVESFRPCFTTSIPAEPGMSGGFVYFPREGYTIAACGIVCADNSSPEARLNQLVCGESVIAYSWPALALKLPEQLSENAPSYTLHDMMRKGTVPMAIGGIDQIEISNRELNGDCTIEYKVR